MSQVSDKKPLTSYDLSRFTNDLTPRFTLVEHVDFLGGDLVNLNLSEFLKDGESSISGKTMKKRATRKLALMGPLAGQEHGEALLALQNPKLRREILEEWQQFILAFPGTVWEDSEGDKWVYCLAYGPAMGWAPVFRGLHHKDWDDSVRVVHAMSVKRR